jgi:hypothetical protein
MRAVEQGGVQLYEKALEELQHEMHRTQLEKFLDQTRRHVELCDEMMEAADADQSYGSPGAEAAERKARGLISTEVPEELVDLNNFENLVLAETKDHWNWETLSAVAGEVSEVNLKRVVSRAVREVQKQEVDHLRRMKQALTQMALELAHRLTEREKSTSSEEEGAEA